jgi:hypothetical protein
VRQVQRLMRLGLISLKVMEQPYPSFIFRDV